MTKLSKYHQAILRREDELRCDTVSIEPADIPQPHFDELCKLKLIKQYIKSKRKNGNWKQGSVINCHWVCECGAETNRTLARFRKNRSLLCANCLRREASSQMMTERKDKYSELGKQNWRLSIGAWVETNGNPMHHDDIKEQIKRTNLEKYGVENTLQSTELTKHVDWKEHAKRGLEIKKKKGNHPSSSEVIDKFRETMAAKSSDEIKAIKAARSKTWYESHDTPEKVQKLLDKSLIIIPHKHSTRRFGNILYQGKFELAFVQECDADNIITKLSRGPVIKYLYHQMVKWYAIDYLVTINDVDVLVEIKSDFTYRRWLNKNIAKFMAAREYAISNDLLFYPSITKNPPQSIVGNLERLCNSLK